ncbi:RsmB/NOP family class I SAM-dependent RNA methyltransferase [Minwuia sp.]|uniref:RsmB/NOP family class I SAM-dependent RNA methyltransferase n=1 Tax=Minwuia sp. TaxID=2493630 RepID=UPI003A8E656A
MRPGARLAAAIEVLDAIDGEGRPADLIVRDYFKSRRYAGSKDRRAVGELVFGVLRRRGELDWRLASAGLEAFNRLRVLLFARMNDVATSFGGPHDPEQPSSEEQEKLTQSAGLDLDTAPPSARLNFPAWLEPQLADSFGPDWQARAGAALAGRAATDLRVNRLKQDRDSVLDHLCADGIEAEPFWLAPDAIRLQKPVRLEDHPLYRSGVIEIQDAGSQFVGHLLGARAGETVADICAGAGGKTLLIAAGMQNDGRLIASDVDPKRLSRLEARAARAGATCVETHHVAADAPWPAEWIGRMDRVLIDAPCSGTGTWRRQPDQRWKFTQERLTELCGIQSAVLDRACELVRPGGRLLYVTCSFLRAENETAVTEFLERTPQFHPVSREELARDVSIPAAFAEPGIHPWFSLSPHDHGVDSFFAAVLTRALR